MRPVTAGYSARPQPCNATCNRIGARASNDANMIAPQLTQQSDPADAAPARSSSSQDQDRDRAPGSLFADRFEIVGAASSGGMGTVYKARDGQSGGLVGLKILHPSRLGSDDAERFASEAQLLAEVRHPGIVTYLAHGQLPSGPRYLVMEWLEGEDLQQRLARGALSIRESLTLLARIAESLAVAHSRGIVHRDLKPANVFLVAGDLGQAKLIDFGVARRINRSPGITRPGFIIGTPAYMSPEQARGADNLTCAADVFALGCMLYECLSGRSPFAATHIVAVLCRILLEEPTPLLKVCPAAPPAVCQLVERMLAKDAAARLADAAAVSSAIAAILPALPSAADPAATVPPAAPTSVLASEQVLMSLVLARPSTAPPAAADTGAPVDRFAPTLDPGAAAGLATIDRVLLQVNARAHVLVEGTIVVTLPSQGSAHDQVRWAARTALLLRDQLPDAGLVVLTGHGAREQTQVIGNLVESGMRLLTAEQGERRPPSILLDALSAQLISPRFQVERTAQCVYLHGEDVDADETRLLLGRPTPCLGRDFELSSLDAALATCIAERERQVVLVSGAAGEGKSRLRHEFLRRVRQSGQICTILSIRGEPAALPYQVLRDALRRHCQIFPPSSRQAQLERVCAHFPLGAAPQPRLLDFLAELLGVAGAPLDAPARHAAEQDPRLMRDQLRWAFAELLRETCKSGPLLLILDDLQWCDAATLDLIDHAAFALQNTPLFVLGLGRLELAARQPNLFRLHRPLGLALGRLSRRSCERLVRQALTGAIPGQLTEQLIHRLVNHSAGNALFLEELIRATVEAPEEEHPQTVLAMLQARIGELATAPRHALLLASVLGDHFSLRDLVALRADDLDDSQLPATLQALRDAELLESGPQPDAAAGAELTFRNELIRQAAYALIPASERVALHRRVARHLESTHPSASLRIGSHWLKAEQKAQAILWLSRAAEQALEGHDLDETIRIAEEAIAAGASGAQLGHLRALQATAAFWQSSYQQCQSWALSALLDLRPGSALFFRLLADAFISSSRIGDQATVDALQREAVGIDAAAGAQDERLICLARMSFHFLMGHDLARADRLLAHLTNRLSQDSVPAPLVRAQLLHALGMRAAVLGDMAGYAEKLVEVVAAFEEAGDLRNACIETTTLAIALWQVGQIETAEELCRKNLVRCEQLRVPQATHYTKLTLGLLLARQSNAHAEAQALLSEALKEYMAISHVRRVGLACGYLALLFLDQRSFAQAELMAQQAAVQLAEAGGFHTWALALRADILLQAGRPRDALALAQEAVERLLQQGGMPIMELLPFAVLGETLCALAQPEAAKEVVLTALGRLRARLAQIKKPAWQTSYLALPEQTRLHSLARLLCPCILESET